MPLKKGFIKQAFPFSAIPKHKFYLGIAIGVLQVAVVYFLSCFIREALRWGSSTMVGEPWLLSDEERQFYNLFFAFISLVWGQNTCVSIWLTGTSQPITHHRLRNHRRDILNDHQVLLWVVLLFVLKTGMLYAIYFGHDNNHYVFSFYPDYELLFIGFAVVIFLHQWLTLRRKFRFPLKYVFSVGICYVGIAALLSMVNIADHQKMDAAHRDYKRLSTYQLDLPQIPIAQHLRKMRKDMDIFLVYPKTDTLKQNEIHIWGENKRIDFEDLGMELESHKLKTFHHNIPQIVYRLHIDKEASYGMVKQLKRRMQIYDCLKVAYMGAEKGYEKNKKGLLYLFPPLCEDEKVLERAKIKNVSSLPLTPPAPPCLPKLYVKENGVVFLEIDNQNQLFIEGKKIGVTSISPLLQSIILLHSEDLVFILKVDEEAKYGFYTQLMNSLLSTYKSIRNETAMAKFGELYDDLSQEEMAEIRLKYPFKVAEQ